MSANSDLNRDRAVIAAVAIGDRVIVTPSRPGAKGRGEGTIVSLGTLLAMVKFDNIKGRGPAGSIACFVADLQRGV